MGAREERLKQLQEELVHLKSQVPGLSLKKSTPAQSGSAPFPISCTADVAAPPDAERFDVAAFTLVAHLQARALDATPAAVAAAVAVEVVSADLPRALRGAIAARLHATWAAADPAPGRLALAVLWLEARRQYAALLSLLPELLEPYQTQDASGSTQRRWAVLSDQTSVTIDAAAPAPARAAAAASSAPRAPASGGGAAASRTLDAGTAAGEGPELPRGLAQELEFLKKRHGLRVVPCGQLQGGPAGGASAAAAGAASAQLAGLRLGEQPAAVAGREQSPPSPMPAPEAPAVAAFEAELRPTDPAWDAAHPLLLRGWVAAGYPHPGSLHVSVSPRQQPPLPDLQREVLERLLAGEAAAAAGRPGALRAVLRYVENRAGQLWEQAADIAAEVARRRRQAAQQAGRASLQGAQPARQGTQLGSGSNDSGGSGSGSSSGSELDDDGAGWPAGSSGSSGSSSTSGSQHGGSEAGQSGGEGEEGGAPARGGGGGHSAAVLPLALALEGLQLEGVDAVEVLRLDLQACCARCGATRDLSFATAAVALPSDGGGGGQGAGVLAAAAECPSCHAEWRVELAPKLVHERSNVLAHVRAAGCAPRDLLPSMLAGQCGRCAASAAFRAAAVGRWNERRCSSCHELLRFQCDAALFVPQRQQRRERGAGGGASQPGGQERRRGGDNAATAAAFNGLLQVGQPLPERGTCRHYKHSYRWLRFPCCGRRFPCDLCHEELTDGHDMKWATRMVCGFCSSEQPVAPQCKACGKKLATSAAAPSGRRTRFWEGGQGQRDPSKLHKNDPRRYRGRHKTQSAKHKRVGQGAKAGPARE